MLTQEQINENKCRFIELINQIERPNFKKDEFLQMLENSDFFYAPASTKYHNSFEGGLCDHCLNVYKNFNSIIEMSHIFVSDLDSLIILPLFHDLSKINLYRRASRNVKHYCTEEEYNADPKAYRTSDALGNFKWESVMSWETVPSEERFIFGNHEESSDHIASLYIPLRREEHVAILRHMGGMGYDSVSEGIYDIYRKYPIAFALYMADFMSTIVDEETN